MKKIEINVESLEKAIKEFNSWNKAARIYLDTSDGYFETSVYANDLQASGSYSEDNFIAVYSKREINGDKKIAERRKSYIIDYSNLILDGWETFQAQNKLADEYPFV